MTDPIESKRLRLVRVNRRRARERQLSPDIDRPSTDPRSRRCNAISERFDRRIVIRLGLRAGQNVHRRLGLRFRHRAQVSGRRGFY
jgi:hypothetical protein